MSCLFTYTSDIFVFLFDELDVYNARKYIIVCKCAAFEMFLLYKPEWMWIHTHTYRHVQTLYRIDISGKKLFLRLRAGTI